MPVDIEIVEGEQHGDNCDVIIIDDCIVQTVPTFVIASIRYGEVIQGIELQTENRIKQMEYPEFMYINYSRLGDFVYRDCLFRLENFVLNNQNLTTNQQCAFLLENRTAMVVYSMNANELRRIINGTFMAIIEITLWSSAIQMGLKINYTLNVTSAPTKPELINCNHPHIYRIIDSMTTTNCCDDPVSEPVDSEPFCCSELQ
jgi:hypothetical protein